MRKLPDYKEMYLIMARASEQAMNILIDAQRRCEELYMDGDQPPVDFLKLIQTDKQDGQ